MSRLCSICGRAIAISERHICVPTTLPDSGDRIGYQDRHASPSFVSNTLASNIAAALAYSAGFVTGFVFLLHEPYRRDAHVRFHAWQSIFFSFSVITVWVPWNILTANLLAAQSGAEPASGGLALLIAAVNRLFWLFVLVYWLFLWYGALQNQRYRIPMIGRLAAQAGGQ
jgi:uncharacterized membrane protein